MTEIKKWPGVDGEPVVLKSQWSFWIEQNDLHINLGGGIFTTETAAITAWNAAVDACVKAARGTDGIR